MSGGLPGLAGTDHVGFTVPDIEAATRFNVDVIGCILVFEIGPFKSDDDWMQVQLGVDPRAVIRSLRMFRCKTARVSKSSSTNLRVWVRFRRATAMWVGITWPFMSRI
jgi:catechol 2,3-dioxygenase-like lactoylglutathione lyase family enzyme